MAITPTSRSLAVLCLAAVVAAAALTHGDDITMDMDTSMTMNMNMNMNMNMDMDMDMNMNHANSQTMASSSSSSISSLTSTSLFSTITTSPTAAPSTSHHHDSGSYFAYPEHESVILGHIALMVLAWFFILPIGVMLSIAKSKHTLPVQFIFLVFNAFGVLLSVIYNASTPDLYENNAHHKMGWIATWT
ncbi:hypothetical protein KEM54_002853, partial [Ascosphaera aggregata]